MRRELILGGLVSTGIHVVVFLAPWSPMPRIHTPWSPIPELQISLPVPAGVGKNSRKELPHSEPPASEEKPQHTFAATGTPEPPRLGRQNPVSKTQPSAKPKPIPRPEEKKKEAAALASASPTEHTTESRPSTDPSPGGGDSQAGSQEVRGLAGKGEETGGSQPSSGGGEPPKAQLRKAFPRYGKNPKPAYPDAARRRGYEGKVILLVRVLKDGSPSSVRVAHSSGYKLLDQAAAEAVANWEFVPAFSGEEPVEMEVEVPILFRLE